MMRLPIILMLLFTGVGVTAQPIKVELVKDSAGSYTILRGGEPYYIKGAGGTNKSLFPELAARGGNSIRTWGVDATSGQVLREAEKNSLTVMLGLWMKKERDGFDYNDTVKVKEQLESFRNYVRSFRNYPALIAWSIGNEIEIGASNLKMWDAVNDISKMIHEEDTNHLTLTVTASINTSKANAIAERAPDLDMLGVNNYGGISGMHSTIVNSNWDKPYLLTEWGVNGPWEVKKTSWGAPMEATSTEKAALFLSRYDAYIRPYYQILPGSYAFYWNSKFEATETWFGLFVKQASTEMIDVLEYSWTGQWAENRAPQIVSLKINGKEQTSNLKLMSRTENMVTLEANDPEGDVLSYEFLVKPENGSEGVVTIPGATFTALSGLGGFSESNSMQIDFESTHNKKNLRLYALVRDGNGHIATATFPFQTDFAPDDTTTIPEDTLAIGYENIDGLRMYPNPFQDKVFLSSQVYTGSLSISVFSCSGRRLALFEIQESSEVSLDLSGLRAGLYFLEIKTASGDTGFYKLFKEQ